MNKERLKNKIFYPGYDLSIILNPTYDPTEEQIAAALETLSERERFILKRRISEPPMTLEAIAIILPRVDGGIGVIRERVRQVEAKAFRKLRHPSRLTILGFKYSR